LREKPLSYLPPEWHDARMNSMALPLSNPSLALRRLRAFFSFFFIECSLCPLLALLAVVMVPQAHAQIPGAPLNVPATLETETAAPAPGQTVTLAFHFKPKPGWHGYWENPGDAGFGMQLKWNLPKGVAAGKPRYPVPQPLIISGLMNHVFEHEYAVLVNLTLDKEIAAGTPLPVKVRGDWLSCTDQICVPEGGDLAIDLVAGGGDIGQAERARFDAWRSALPVPLDRQAVYTIDGKSISLAIPYPKSAAVADVWFFPRTDKLFRYAAVQSARRTGDWLIVTGEVDSGFSGQIDGLLRFNDAQGIEVRAMPGAVPAGGDTVSVFGESKPLAGGGDGLYFLSILGFSIVGGLLLNLMPCVFPILGLKAIAIAKAGGDERQARRDALAYSAGIVLSCLALGAVMLALRAGGEEIGWAFQLQDPAIVLLLLLLMVAITANLAGLFEVGGIRAGDKLTRQGGIAGSFWTGVLAAVVATPCTGPFMAVAMGAALLLPVAQALLIFAGLGLGLALPFLAIAYIPALRSRMPKPGPWMNNFRKWMAVPMALTSLALLWLLWRLNGLPGLVVGLTAGVALTVGIAIAVSVRGKAETAEKHYYLSLLVVIFGMGNIAFNHLPESTNRGVAAGHGELVSSPFSEDLLRDVRAKQIAIFVYFTADWCVTCKVNEAAAINRDVTIAVFNKAGITTLKGDYTRRDPAITRFLAKHGRSGVPLYLYYPAGQEPQVLPQVLTVDMLTELAK
jgi:DsbC/DsbD-like thiol-disulfide interchange protein/cytochrome c biogenesis protein CcdA